MGTQIVTSDNGETDAECIIKYTRKSRKPPEYVPRSRSLGDLPGGLRVPIIKKKPESRLQQKHEANLAGLEELKMLRQKHCDMMEDVRSVSAGQQDMRRSVTHTRLSTSSLASIKEEPTSHNEIHQQNDNNRVRFSIASDNNSSCGSECTSASLESLNQSEKSSESNTDTRSRKQIIEEFQRNFESTYNVRPVSNIQQRRASIQVVTATAPPPVDNSIRPKLRRASIQCEAVLTKQSEREDSISKVISDFKIQYNFPSPIHAITRQYGSSTDIKTMENVETTPTFSKRDYKSILSEWACDKKIDTPPTISDDCPSQQTLVDDKQKNYDRQSGISIQHDRNSSCTSDYFGSNETLNSVRTFPLNRNNIDPEPPRRRQSLPVILTRDPPNEHPPKVPQRRKSFLDKSTCDKTPEIPGRLRKTKLSESDDGIFNDDETDIARASKYNTRKDKCYQIHQKDPGNQKVKPLETAL